VPADAEQIDFAIITALDEERDAVLAKFERSRKLEKDGVDAHTYYEAEVSTARADGSAYRVIITSLSDMGPKMAAQKALAVVTRWHPRNVLLVGIACGIRGKTNLGDVLVSTQIADYELGKVWPDGSRDIRWKGHPAGSNLLDTAVNLEPSQWLDLLKHPRPGPGEPIRQRGVIASGGDVVANDDMIRLFQKQWPKLIGIEMEAGGVASGLHGTPDRPEFLMIKGVSDQGEGKETLEAWRPYAADAAAAFALALIRTGTGPAVRNKRKRRRWMFTAVAVVVALIAVAMSIWRVQTAAPTPQPSASPQPILLRPSVAILSFRNDSHDAGAEWLATAVPEILSRAMAEGGTLRVIPRAETVQVETDFHLHESATIAVETLRRVRKRIHADSLIVGSYSLIGNSEPALVHAEIRLLNIENGRIVATIPVSVTDTRLVGIVINAANPLREKLKASELSRTQISDLEASFPSEHSALRLYANGLSKLRQPDAESARVLLSQAATTEDHPLIRSALAAAFAALGRETEALREIRRALARPKQLLWEQRMEIEAQFYKMRFHDTDEKQKKDWAEAIEKEKSLWQSARDAIEHGVQLANSQISADEVNEAFVTIEALRRLPPALADDGRIDLVESRAWQEEEKWAKQQLLATSAAGKGGATSDHRLVGQARLLETTALFGLGDMNGASAAIEEARSSFEAVGDRSGIARTLEQEATAVGYGGNLEGESILLHKALDLHRQLHDEASVARVLLNMGYVLVRNGKTNEAQRSFSKALTTFRESGGTYAQATTLSEIGAFMFYRGDLAAAEKRYREALSLFEKVPSQNGRATALTNIGEVLSCRGNLEEARKLHEQSLAINIPLPDPKGVAYDKLRLGEIFALQGDRAAARAWYQQALKIHNVDKELAAETKIALAGLLVEDGDAIEAEKLARQAEATLRVGRATDRSFLALAAIARALLAQGRQKEAVETADHAWEEVADSEDRQLRFNIAIVRARARAASKNPRDADAAVTFLEPLRADAERSRFVVSELEIRLGMGEIEVAAGRAGGRERLAAVERDAKAKRIVSIVTRAGRNRHGGVR
jgi:nucleoside phosphorylase/tetratricopeptide (TPR) repeat protein/TolB-like protein